MNGSEARGSRLAHAIELLRSLLDEDGSADRTSPNVYFSPMPPPDAEGRLSATDILSWWFRPPSRHSNPWDDFFQHQPTGRKPQSPGPLPQVPPRPPDVRPTAQTGVPSWTAVRAFLPEEEVELADDDADAAVHCLYEFLHAIARRDVNQAMECVSERFHSFEDDREVDSAALRRRIESLLDTLEGCELEASLSVAPEPIFHPNGILIYAEMQIDVLNPQNDSRRTVVDRKVAVFERQGDGSWKLSALSPAHA